MKDLIEMVNIIRNVKIKSTDLLTISNRKKTNSRVFYEKLLAGEFKTDQDAAYFFFKTDTTSSNYKNLKRSLKQKIINSLFFIKASSSYSDYEKAFLYCCKNMFAARILLFLQANYAGIYLCKKVFSKALNYELSEFVVESSRYLRLHAGIRIGNSEKFEHYHNHFKKYEKIREAELKAEEHYIRLILPKVKKKSNDKETYRVAKKSYQKLAPYIEKYDSPFLHFLGEFIHVIALISNQSYQEAIDVCEKAIQFFEAKPYTYKTPLRVFLHNQLICYTQLKEYEKGKEVVEKSNLLVRVGTYNWFQNNELNLILALHSKNYQEALGILDNSINHNKFKTLLPVFQEQWMIYEAYIYFLVVIEKIELDESESKRFRLGKFLNSIPTYSQDKRGLNIPILIIQILFMIVQKEYDKSIDRIGAIEKYCSRYLTNDDNFRSNCFIKMLLQIPISGFHRAGVERRTKKYYNRLKSIPLNISQQPHEIEIIPYEDLWEIIMASLETRFYKFSR